MGMFDSLIVTCLFCKEEIEEQTKSGPCMMQYFKWDDPDLPVWMMQEFNNTEIECYSCNRRFIVRYDYEIIVKSRKLEPVDNLDLLELKYDEQQKLNQENEGG